MQGEKFYKYPQQRRTPRYEHSWPQQSNFHQQWTPDYLHSHPHWQQQYRPSYYWDHHWQGQRSHQYWQPRPMNLHHHNFDPNYRNYRHGQPRHTQNQYGIPVTENNQNMRGSEDSHGQEHHSSSASSSQGFRRLHVDSPQEAVSSQNVQEVPFEERNHYRCISLLHGFLDETHVHPQEVENNDYPTLYTSEQLRQDQQQHYVGDHTSSSGQTELQRTETEREFHNSESSHAENLRNTEQTQPSKNNSENSEQQETEHKVSSHGTFNSQQKEMYKKIDDIQIFESRRNHPIDLNQETNQQIGTEQNYETDLHVQATEDENVRNDCNTEPTDNCANGENPLLNTGDTPVNPPSYPETHQIPPDHTYQLQNSGHYFQNPVCPGYFNHIQTCSHFLPVMVIVQPIPYHFTVQCPMCNFTLVPIPTCPCQNVEASANAETKVDTEMEQELLHQTFVTTEQNLTDSKTSSTCAQHVDPNLDRSTGEIRSRLDVQEDDSCTRRDSGYHTDTIRVGHNKSDHDNGISSTEKSVNEGFLLCQESNQDDKTASGENSQVFHKTLQSTSHERDKMKISNRTKRSKSKNKTSSNINEPSNDILVDETSNADNTHSSQLTSRSEPAERKYTESSTHLEIDSTSNREKLSENINLENSENFRASASCESEHCKIENKENTSTITAESASKRKRIWRLQTNHEIPKDGIRVKCPLAGLYLKYCEWQGSVEQRLLHVEKEHSSDFENGSTTKLSKNSFKVLKAYDELFICYNSLHPTKKHLYCLVHHACSKIPCDSRFHYTCELISEDNLQKIEDTRIVAPIYETLKFLMSTGKCIRIDRKALNVFKDKPFYIAYKIVKSLNEF